MDEEERLYLLQEQNWHPNVAGEVDGQRGTKQQPQVPVAMVERSVLFWLFTIAQEFFGAVFLGVY